MTTPADFDLGASEAEFFAWVQSLVAKALPAPEVNEMAESADA